MIKVAKKHSKSINECLLKETREDRKLLYQYELRILEKYIPKPITEVEVTNAIAEQFIDKGIPVTMPDAMKYLKSVFGDRFDGKVASKIVKSMI